MKKLVSVVALAVTTFVVGGAHASDKENGSLLRLDAGVVAIHQTSVGSWGLGGAIEPKLQPIPDLTLGLRIEGFGTVGGSLDDGTATLGLGAGEAISAKTELYLGSGRWLRPFVAASIGYYHFGSQTYAAGSDHASVLQLANDHWGMAPTLGLELGSLIRIGVTYNIVFGASESKGQSASVGPHTASLDLDADRNLPSSSYVSFEIGFRFGGRQPMSGVSAHSRAD